MYVFARHQNKNDTGVSCVNLSPTDTGLLGNFLLLSLEHNIWLRGSFAHLPFSGDIVIISIFQNMPIMSQKKKCFCSAVCFYSEILTHWISVRILQVLLSSHVVL